MASFPATGDAPFPRDQQALRCAQGDTSRRVILSELSERRNCLGVSKEPSEECLDRAASPRILRIERDAAP
jgi:hypothetical protein